MINEVIFQAIIQLQEDRNLVKNEETIWLIRNEIGKLISDELKRCTIDTDKQKWREILRVENSIFRRWEKRQNKQVPKSIPDTLLKPKEFNNGNKLINKIAYALSLIGEGTSEVVAKQMVILESGTDFNYVYKRVQPMLNRLYNFGAIEGNRRYGETALRYKLAPVYADSY